jgi:hypothetical protein
VQKQQNAEYRATILKEFPFKANSHRMDLKTNKMLLATARDQISWWVKHISEVEQEQALAMRIHLGSNRGRLNTKTTDRFKTEDAKSMDDINQEIARLKKAEAEFLAIIQTLEKEVEEDKKASTNEDAIIELFEKRVREREDKSKREDETLGTKQSNDSNAIMNNYWVASSPSEKFLKNSIEARHREEAKAKMKTYTVTNLRKRRNRTRKHRR